MKLVNAVAAIFAAVALAAPTAQEGFMTDAEYLAETQALYPDGNWTMVVPEGGPQIGPQAIGGVYPWNCDEFTRVSSGQHAALRQAHKDFNKLFGTGTLTSVKNQAYAGICKGYSFVLQNNSCCKRTEIVNARNLVANTDPGRYQLCRTSSLDDPWQTYWFTKGNWDSGGKPMIDSIRRC